MLSISMVTKEIGADFYILIIFYIGVAYLLWFALKDRINISMLPMLPAIGILGSIVIGMFCEEIIWQINPRVLVEAILSAALILWLVIRPSLVSFMCTLIYEVFTFGGLIYIGIEFNGGMFDLPPGTVPL